MGTASTGKDPDRDFDLDDFDFYPDIMEVDYGPHYKTREGLPFCLAAGNIRNAMGDWWRTPGHNFEDMAANNPNLREEIADGYRIGEGDSARLPNNVELTVHYEEAAREKNRAEYRVQVDEGWMPANAADFLKVWTAIRADDMPRLIRQAIQSGENVSTIELLESAFPTHNIASILRINRKSREQDAA